MRVISKGTLKTFWEKHNDCEQQLITWYREADKARWNNSMDTTGWFLISRGITIG